ncbi:hypothetical protein D8Y20_05810 [Mariprofundus sp. EBB-1]|uniref:hypothetical protein n=1 Tax=Mariprofundus sp. EBB-1 TaxID=2650971 RepID=UPI000EF26813|nr:hypothetical protein [Mariprofundus sp. EBB-1]RLL53017.1 hypothetical protein D8Y20_05810 [Mariprofundus sp. EBB-1]
MKIQNSTPVSGKTTQTTKRSTANGLFGQLLDAESQQTDQPQNHSAQTTDTRAPMQEAWHTLEESVTLLDEAMQCIESGDSPPQKLIQDIEHLRALLRVQVASGGSAIELKQADTLLAVEAERIRAMQS